MAKIFLNLSQAEKLVLENRYKIEKENIFLNACFDISFSDKKITPPIFFPAGNLGQLALIFSTANCFGFSVDREKTYEILIELAGQKEDFYWQGEHFSFCPFLMDFYEQPKIYDLKADDIDFLKEKEKLFLKNKKINSLEEKIEPAALFLVYGEAFSLYPESFLKEENKETKINVFVFQQTLIDQRQKKLANQLIEKKALKLYAGCDQDYLYQVLSTQMENFLYEGLKKNYQNLPIFKVDFNKEGGFKIEALGRVG